MPADGFWMEGETVMSEQRRAERGLSYDELSKIERLRAQEQTRLEEWAATLQRNLDMAIAERDQAQAELRSSSERDTEKLREITDLVVDVLHGRRHSGELLAAIKPYRTGL